MTLMEDELKARVRQDALFLARPDEPRDTPLQRQMQEVIGLALREHDPEQVKKWLEDLKGEVGPARLARILDAFAAAGKPRSFVQ